MDQKIKEISKVSKEEWREYTKTVWQIANIKHSKHPAAFPEEIPHRLIKLFTFWGETVLDPFAGIGTTAIAALKNGRNIISIEQNKEYIKEINNKIKKNQSSLKEFENDRFRNSEAKPIVRHGDCRKILNEIKENSIGLIVTSPPYWNKADYGSNYENLGNIDNYAKFFKEIRPVFEECYRVLMPGRKICIVTANVNQYTNHGLLTFPLATDFSILLRELGFVMVSEIIWNKNGTGGKWGSWGHQRPIFGSYPYPPNFLFKNVHEYILIFMKPPLNNKKGANALNYEDLMGISNRK